MTDTTARDLIQRMAKELDTWLMAHHYGGVPPEIHYAATLVAEACAYLAQPEPEGLTDEELLRCYGLAKRDHCYEGPMDDWPKRAERAATVCGLRAIIASDRTRWGRPAVEPDAQ